MAIFGKLRGMGHITKPLCVKSVRGTFWLVFLAVATGARGWGS
jgi:hypothetical protein